MNTETAKWDAAATTEAVEDMAATLAETAEELEADAKEDGRGTGTYTHAFKRPFVYEGRTVESLTFDWDTLTGNDSLAIERELRVKGVTLVVPAYTGEYLVGMAARACTDRTEEGKRFVGADMIRAMPLGDFQAVTNRARNFLLLAGL